MNHASVDTKTASEAAGEGVEIDDTPASRLANVLLKHLTKGFPTKSKHVRYRTCQLVAQLISTLPEIDEDLYATLQAGLAQRVRDKEVNVREQAVLALAKLQTGEEEEYNDDEDEEHLHPNAESAHRLGEGRHDLGRLIGYGLNDLVRFAVHNDRSLH